ncbi:hypothetical protein ABT095_14575 [Kitasatospora sp. NPDC002227]|uniref:hypothetical protein n=1 Tax=Kitasatospora sp. NPDC002227 TaxID=3154773 RepID=UPI00331BDCF6
MTNTTKTADGEAAPLEAPADTPLEAAPGEAPPLFSVPDLKVYVIGSHAYLGLLRGSLVLVKKTWLWVRKGDFVAVFAPALAARRDADKQTGKPPKSTRKATGKGSGGEPEEKPDEPAGPAEGTSGHLEDLWEQLVAALGPPLARGAALTAAGYGSWYFGRASPLVTVTVAVVFACGAAWIYDPTPLAPDASADEQEEDEQEEDEDNDAEPADEAAAEKPKVTPEQMAATISRYVEQAVAVAHQKGLAGVHVDVLLHGLQEEGALRSWDAADFGAYLRSLQIPLRETKLPTPAGKKNRNAVRYDDLTAYLGRPPVPPLQQVRDNTPRDDEAEPALERTAGAV